MPHPGDHRVPSAHVFSEGLLFALVLALLQTAFAAPVMTPFKPEQHGFRFVNSFSNDVLPDLDFRTNGLCGGMSYAALDYYYQRWEIPRQDYRPANRTVLERYLYRRQIDSIQDNVDQWAELAINPGGIRDEEFFRRGLEGGSDGQITALRSFIDRGEPVALGLQAAETSSHQVVAVGYDLGRYQGNFGDHQDEFKIFVYDPNYPVRTMTLVPRFADQTWTYAERPERSWRTYFVNLRHAPQTPPNLPNPKYPDDGTIRELTVQFFTGNDELRGDGDNIDITLKLITGASWTFSNINLGARWLSNYSETVALVLPEPVRPDRFDSLIVQATFGNVGESWDVKKAVIHGVGGSGKTPLKQQGPFHFNNVRRTWTIQLTSP